LPRTFADELDEAPSDVPAAEPAASDEDQLTEEVEGAEAEGGEMEGGDTEERSEKALHRAIPSWTEAVGVVISANLESRAKNPDRRSGGRSRGGHDRRPRGSSGDKSH